MLDCCGAVMHPWARYEVERHWVPRPLLCLIIGENPGGTASEYFYATPERDTADDVVVRRCLLQGLHRQGLIADASLEAFRNAGFLFDHAIRCQLEPDVVQRERQRAMRYASERVADPAHLRPLLAEAKVVWVMGHLANNAVANATGDFPRDRRRLSRAPYPTGISPSSKFFVSEYLTWRREPKALAICAAFSRFARERLVFDGRPNRCSVDDEDSRFSPIHQQPPPADCLETSTTWPRRTAEREQLEISGFIEAYARLPGSLQLEVVTKGEMPDYVVKDIHTGQEYGVELTSVYLNDRSVPDLHMRDESEPVSIPYDEVQLEKYRNRLVGAVVDKICKARKSYDRSRPLLLGVYVNEYISIHMPASEVRALVKRYDGLFQAMAPFSGVVFWNLPNGEAICAKPSGGNV